MRFLLDIPFGRATAQHLEAQGHDCAFARDQLSATASDPEVVLYAAREGRVVLCFDLDIGTLVALSGQPLPGVITFRTTRQSAAYLNLRSMRSCRRSKRNSHVARLRLWKMAVFA